MQFLTQQISPSFVVSYNGGFPKTKMEATGHKAVQPRTCLGFTIYWKKLKTAHSYSRKVQSKQYLVYLSAVRPYVKLLCKY